MMYDYYQTTVGTVLGQALGLLDFVVGASIGYNNYGLSKVWAFTVQNYLTGLSSLHTLRKSRSAEAQEAYIVQGWWSKGPRQSGCVECGGQFVKSPG